MRPWTRRAGATVLLLLAASCAGSCAGPRREPAPAAGNAPTCRAGPDGGPLAERGIGGTGAPVLADRGIGGTGIIGVVTGFGSVCVDGQEVGLDGKTPVTVDTAPADASALRAGQVVALDAGGTDGGLLARSVLVRHEVSGPVEAAGPGRLRVAGQDVVLTDATWIEPGLAWPPAAGAWVAVSGLVRPDGTVEATRVDARTPGPVLVHGMLRLEDGRFWVGGLRVAPVAAVRALLGAEVTVSGVLLGAELQPDAIEPDRLLTDPGSYFGSGVTALLVEGFVVAEGGRVRLGRTVLPASSGFAPAPGRAVVAFSRGPGGQFEAVPPGAHPPGTPAPGGLREPGGSGPGARFDPGDRSPGSNRPGPGAPGGAFRRVPR